MGHRIDPIELIQTQGAADFAFLVSDEGFTGPELTEYGISYRRAELEVEISFFHYCGRDLMVATQLVVHGDPDVGPLRETISLEKAYMAHGLGPAQDVPGHAQTLRALSKSIAMDAQALRRLIAFLKQQRPSHSPAPDRPVSWFQS